MRKGTLIVSILFTGVLVGWCSNTLIQRNSPIRPRQVAPRGALQASEQSIIERFKEAAPSVVFITSIAYQRDWFSFDVQAVPTGTGSGFVWDESGHIVTNYHVIEKAQELEVSFKDGKSYRAKVVGLAPDKDLAVLKLNTPPGKLRPIPIGSSVDLQVGQSLLAIGNPFGLDHTLTTGVVSALGREIQSATRRRISGVIQTDAAINPGNSGGPLLDSAGRLVGINTAIQSTSGSSAGIGFAVPVDTLNRVVPQLIARGQVARADLGFDPMPSNWAAYFEAPKGVAIMRIHRGGAADRAGLEGLTRTGQRWSLGDVLVAANGKPVATYDGLLDVVENEPLGATLQLDILRGSRRLRISLRLEPEV